MLAWWIDVSGLGFEGFGIYLEALLYTWRRLLPCDDLMFLEVVL